MNRTKVFINYSHQDAEWLERLQVHLKPLEREGIIDRWDDTRIKAGAKWLDEIKNALAEAKVAVLLVSADFLASDFIAQAELPSLLAAAEMEGAVILSVILSPSLFKQTNLAQFQAVNSPDRPLIGMERGAQEQVFVEVAEAIQQSIAKESSDSFEESIRAPGDLSNASPDGPEQFGTDPKSPPTPSPNAVKTGILTQHRSLGTWVFGSLLFVFIVGVFILAPQTLPEFKHRLLAICAALLSGFFAYFLTGEISVEIKALKSRVGDLALRAAGGLAMFVVVLLWWLSPLAPVAEQPRPKPVRQVMAQTLSGSIRDEANEPLRGAQVSLPKFDMTDITDRFGRFQFQVTAPHQAEVELMAQKEGYQTYEQYATLGNTGLSFTMKIKQ